MPQSHRRHRGREEKRLSGKPTLSLSTLWLRWLCGHFFCLKVCCYDLGPHHPDRRGFQWRESITRWVRNLAPERRVVYSSNIATALGFTLSNLLEWYFSRTARLAVRCDFSDSLSIS